MIKTIMIATASVLITSFTAYGLHSLAEKRLEVQFEKQKTALISSCNADKAITEKVSHDYQEKITSLNTQLVNAHGMYDSLRIAVTSKSPIGRNGSSSTNKPSDAGNCRHSIDGGNLIALLGEGEHYRLQLLACQNFITAIQAH